MADPVSATLLIVSAASSVYGHNQQVAAANAATKTQENLLNRRIQDQRNATVENSKRRLAERDRYLSKVRVQNAASGFSNSGTQLAVFGEIQNRLDEQINEATSQAFTQINQNQDRIRANRFANDQRVSALNTQLGASLINTAVGGYRQGKADYNRYGGNNPFGIFGN